MPRPPLGERAMTGAEREARRRARIAQEHERWREALERIREVATAREARRIAAEALKD